MIYPFESKVRDIWIIMGLLLFWAADRVRPPSTPRPSDVKGDGDQMWIPFWDPVTEDWYYFNPALRGEDGQPGLSQWDIPRSSKRDVPEGSNSPEPQLSLNPEPQNPKP